MTNDFIASIPLWALFIFVVVLIYSSLVLGFKLASRLATEDDKASVPPISSVVASLLALLAFLLALTFNSTAQRYEARKLLLLEETNAISTAYLRADFLPTHEAKEIKALLKNYVYIRANIKHDMTAVKAIILESERIHEQLWGITLNSAALQQQPALLGRLTDALNNVFDLHAKRVVYGTQYKVHSTIWWALFMVGMLALASLGFQFGLSGGKRYQISLLLALSFSAILLLILDLERPVEGTIRISTQPLLNLYETMQ